MASRLSVHDSGICGDQVQCALIGKQRATPSTTARYNVGTPENVEVHKMIRGIIRGKTIELDTETGLAEGQEVTVTVRPVNTTTADSAAGEGLKQAFGGWGDDEVGLDEYLTWNRLQRKFTRSESE